MASEFVLAMYPEANTCLQSDRKSELDGIDATASKKIPLHRGYPPCKMVDRISEIMKKACQKRLTEEAKTGSNLLHYGFRMGDPLFRAQLAKFLTDQYGYDVRKERLLATCGATSGLYHLCTMFFRPGDLVFAEEPSYYLALDMMEKDIKRKIIHVPLDTKGILPEELENTVKQFYPKEGFVPSKERLYWSMVYLISCFQNPTGACLSEDRCKAVVAIARKYHLLVVSDDLYGPLHWSFDTDGSTRSHAPKPLKYFDREDDEGFFGNIVSNNSFSKIMAPGLRIGWMEGPPVVLAKFACSAYLGGAGDFNHFTSGLLGTALESGAITNHIVEIRRQYKEKIEAMQQVFEEKLKGVIKYSLPEGGFFVWIQLPTNMNCDDLMALCLKKYNVTFACGNKFTKNPGSLSNFIRISFSHLEKDVFIEGVKELSDAILELQATNDSQ